MPSLLPLAKDRCTAARNNQRQPCELRGSSATKRPRTIRPCPGHTTCRTHEKRCTPSNQFQHSRAKARIHRSVVDSDARTGRLSLVSPPARGSRTRRDGCYTHSRPNGRMARPPPKGKRHCKDFFTNRPAGQRTSSTTSVTADLWSGSGLARTFVGVQIQAVGSARQRPQAVSRASSGVPAMSPVG
jgi:hypothetical protein